jgi:beta-lactamase regulating signal transducer with metallopeptidase domain
MIYQLFQTILFSTITGSILILLLIFLSPIMKRKVPAKWRYYLWVPVLLQLLIIVPLAPAVPNHVTTAVVQFADNVTHQRPIFVQEEKQINPVNKSKGETTSQATVTNGTQKVSVTGNSKINFTELTNNILKALPLLWLIGFLASLLWMLSGYFLYLKKIRTNDVATDLFQIVCTELGIKRKIGIKGSSIVPTPMLLGVFRPSVILPEQEYSEIELRYIFMHELMHQKRSDLILRWMVTFVKAIHWFNPLVYFMGREINQSCELSCDEAVVSRLSQDETNLYGKTILEVLERSIGMNNSAFSTSMCEKNKNRMRSRMLAILNFKKPNIYTSIFAAIMVGLIILSGLFLGGVFKTGSGFDITKVKNQWIYYSSDSNQLYKDGIYEKKEWKSVGYVTTNCKSDYGSVNLMIYVKTVQDVDGYDNYIVKMVSKVKPGIQLGTSDNSSSSFDTKVYSTNNFDIERMTTNPYANIARGGGNTGNDGAYWTVEFDGSESNNSNLSAFNFDSGLMFRVNKSTKEVPLVIDTEYRTRDFWGQYRAVHCQTYLTASASEITHSFATFSDNGKRM